MFISTPRQLLGRHYEVFLLAIGLFLIGFVIGVLPQNQQSIISEAQKMSINPTAVLTNIRAIAVNNGEIALIIYLGWFFMPVLGVGAFPPLLMIFNVGQVFGAVTSYASYSSLFILPSFGILEALGYVFAMASSLLFPKYAILKVLGESVSLAGILGDAFTLLGYSFLVVLLAGSLEALLINPPTFWFAVGIGTITTIVVLYAIVSVE